MKNKIKLFISVFIIVHTIFSLKSIAVESSNISNYTIEQKAIREVADAYYNKGIKGQYCSFRNSKFYPPEEGTSQHTIYSICSDFTLSVYYQAFGMKVQGGHPSTSMIIAYGRKYYDLNNIKTNDVIEYWEKTSDENGNTVYKDNKGNVKNINLSTVNGRKEYAVKLLKECDLQIGDILCYHPGGSASGHALLVYDIVYNEKNEPIDAIIRESTSTGHEQKTTKITKGLSYVNVLNENNNICEGTFRECYLSNVYNISSNEVRNSMLYNCRDMPYFTILRPLLKDDEGNYIGKYYYSKFESKNDAPTNYICTERTLENYEITSSTLSRINYSKIDIEKTVNVFNNSVVNLGDELEYTIKIANNSNTDYKNFDIIENISDYVEILDNANGIIDSNKIVWNIQSLLAKQSIELKYKTKVKKNVSYLGKKIISTGTVAGIPSSTVSNYISFNLYESQKSRIKNITQSVISSNAYSGWKLITKIYNESFGINLNIENLDIADLIKVRDGTVYYPQNSTSVPTIFLNKENDFYNTVLSNYYGGLYTNKNGYISLKLWENETYLGSRSERADNIYKENFQTGDILVYKNTQSGNSTYKTEDGIYYLIYISEKDKITVNGEEIYGFIGINEDGALNRIYRNESDYISSNDYSIYDLRTLLGKDYYVVLRPSMVLDIIPMKLQISYDITNITNQDVQVVIVANEELLPIEGWTLSEDKKMLMKTFNKNIKENIKIYDYSGNEKKVNININNIDKEKPELNVNYSSTKTTNKDVVVTINSNEEIKNINGWILSEDKKKITKTYSENKTENIEITDLAGNISTAVIDIKNIDKENPIAKVKYSTKEQTLDDIIVTIEANEKLQELEGWQLSDDQKTMIKTYTKNNEETITIYDLAGNNIEKLIKVENIDKEKPKYELNYSTTLSTNQDVIVTIVANEEIQGIEGWILSEDNKLLTKTYTKNTEEEITIRDIVGNNTNKSVIRINNIDKEKPEIKINYSIIEKTNQDVIVTITANEKIREVEGWTLSIDRKYLTKTFKKNGEEQITINDEAKNAVITNIKVSNIVKTEERQVDMKSISNNDAKKAKMTLPNTGIKSTLIYIVTTMIITTIMYIKFRKYKNIK